MSPACRRGRPTTRISPTRPPSITGPGMAYFLGRHTDRPYGALRICHTWGSVVGVGSQFWFSKLDICLTHEMCKQGNEETRHVLLSKERRHISCGNFGSQRRSRSGRGGRGAMSRPGQAVRGWRPPPAQASRPGNRTASRPFLYLGRLRWSSPRPGPQHETPNVCILPSLGCCPVPGEPPHGPALPAPAACDAEAPASAPAPALLGCAGEEPLRSVGGADLWTPRPRRPGDSTGLSAGCPGFGTRCSSEELLPLHVGFAYVELRRVDDAPSQELLVRACDEITSEDSLAALLDFMDYVLGLPKVSLQRYCGSLFQR